MWGSPSFCDLGFRRCWRGSINNVRKNSVHMTTTLHCESHLVLHSRRMSHLVVQRPQWTPGPISPSTWRVNVSWLFNSSQCFLFQSFQQRLPASAPFWNRSICLWQSSAHGQSGWSLFATLIVVGAAISIVGGECVSKTSLPVARWESRNGRLWHVSGRLALALTIGTWLQSSSYSLRTIWSRNGPRKDSVD